MILFVNDLTVIDFSYLCEKRGVVGESWIVDLTLHGALNQASMVLDFALVKKQVKKIIDTTIDHTLAVPTRSDTLSLCTEESGVTLDFKFADNKHLAMHAPMEACCLLEAERVDIASVTEFLIANISAGLPDNVEKVELVLRPEHADGFYYHYSHGLKKHDGNCQRIVHGHRSKIRIFVDDMAMPRLQKNWSERWCDIYLGSEEDIVSPAALEHITTQDNDVCFAYTSSQGYFELAISKEVCEILPCDTTVECIADFIAAELKAELQDKKVCVTAFEGVGKGSIAYA